MPSYLRLLTEKASEVLTPPTGHTAIFTSSGESTFDQYDLYAKNPEGFTYKIGGTGATISYGNSTFYSGLTVYSGGYTSSGAPTVALAFNGDLSATTSGGTIYVNNLRASSPMNLDNPIGFNGYNGNLNQTARFNFNSLDGTNWYGYYLGLPHTDNGIAVHIPSGTTGLTHAITLSGSMSGTNSVAFGLNQTSNHGFAASGTALYTAVFNSGNTVSSSGATAFGSGNTSSGPVSFSMGGGNTSSGEVSFTIGSGNTAGGKLSFAGGINNTSSGLASGTLGTGNTVTDDGSYSFVFGEDNTISVSHASAFGENNTISTQGFRGFAANLGNTVTGRNSSAFGSGNTVSGTTHFVVGSNNFHSDTFAVGANISGVLGQKGNIITTRQSGVTISMSANTLAGTNGTNNVSALTVLSGTGSQPLGFKLPLIQLQAAGSQPAIALNGGSSLNAWTTLTGSTSDANKGLMFWDGSNIRVYTGATFPYYATVATLGGGGSL